MSGSGWLKKAGLVLAAMLILAPGLASASNLGFYIGTGLGAAVPNVSGDDMDVLEPETGFCFELIHLGYNFTENLGVTFQWGAADGLISDDVFFNVNNRSYQAFGDDSVWGQGYLDLGLRFSLPVSEVVVPYFEVGAGNYVYLIQGDEADFTSDPVIGWRLALGANYYIGNFYIAPEFSYHFTHYDKGELDHDILGKSDIDFDNTGDMALFLIKIGYHFRR